MKSPASLDNFYRLRASERLPAELRRQMPEIIWIAPDQITPPTEPSREIVLAGTSIDPANSRDCALVTLGSDQRPQTHFGIAGTMEGIVLERYHAGLEPTLEMRLPFNYSRIPPWLKGLARGLRKGSLSHEPKVPFPSGDPGFVVAWLAQLAEWTEQCPTYRHLNSAWPNGCKAAVAISHDVDTDWLFRNPTWIDRFCDLEEGAGLYGSWYCVPMYSQSKVAAAGIERLRKRGCEIGCHGYNHDAKWPLLSGEKFEQRVRAVREFRDRWGIRGFRSEWLWRTPEFLQALAGLFVYESSVPMVSAHFTSQSRNGCGTCFPYLTYGDLVELPLTLPMDEDRNLKGLGLDEFWSGQTERAHQIIERGGLVMVSLHPQPHQAANDATLAAVSKSLQEITATPGLWIARPDHIADWARSSLTATSSFAHDRH